MSDRRKIFNLCLAVYGDESVTNPDTDDTPQAGDLRDVYDQVYDAALSKHPWNDAIRLANLGAKAQGPAFGYGFSYALPESPVCLRVLVVNQEPTPWYANFGFSVPGRGPLVAPSKPNWVVRGREIQTDFGAPLPIEFIARVSEGNLRESVAKVVAMELAVATAFKRTQEPAMVALAKEERAIALSEARTEDAQEGGQINPFQSDFLQSRG